MYLPFLSDTYHIKVTGYSLLINILFFAQDPGMHEQSTNHISLVKTGLDVMQAFNFTAKKACNSCAGWVGGAGNLIAVPAVNSLRMKY